MKIQQITNILLIMCIFTLSAHGQMVVKKKNELATDLVLLVDVSATPDSVFNGHYVLIYKSKTLVKGYYKQGIKDGVWTSYHNNGNKRVIGQYINGVKHGPWKYLDDKGAVIAKFSYNKGKPTGHWQGYYPSHNKAIDLVYLPSGNPSQCIHYFSDKIISMNHEYTYTPEDTTVLLSYYYHNYNLFHYETRVNNQLDGVFETLHSNAVTWEKMEYKEGKLMTLFETRSAGGVPRKNNDFRNGNGVVTRYNYTGTKYSETTYKNGQKNGPIQIYDMGGKALGNGTFNQNIPIGEWEIYSKYHKLTRLLDFDTLAPGVMEKTFVSAAPKETEEGPYLHGYRHGIWKTFDPYGELVTETPYAYGYPNGAYRYYEGAKLKQQIPYEYGNKKGISLYLDPFGKPLSEVEYVSETRIDTQWYRAPEKDYMIVNETQKTSNQKLLFFVPFLPGMEAIYVEQGLLEQKEKVFPIQRTYGYTYAPELVLPKFPGGSFGEKEFIRKNVTIPEHLKKAHINGTVMVRYRVNELGMVEQATILKTIWPELDSLILTMVRNLPPHQPATFNGLPIDCYIVREIDVSLN